MTVARRAGLLVLVVLIAGCGSSVDGKKAATRPAALFAQPPSGLRYKVPDAATVKQVKGLMAKSAPGLSNDDIAVRQVVEEGGFGKPVAFGVTVDSHGSGDSSDALKGFDEESKKNGADPQHVVVAGTDTSQAKVSGTIVSLALKNGYVVEAIAPDAPTVKRVLKQLIVAAGQAER
jgi:hypothetical protein